MSLVLLKGAKIAVNMQGPYCELPRVLGPLQPSACSHTADGIIIIAGEGHTEQHLTKCRGRDASQVDTCLARLLTVQPVAHAMLLAAGA